MPFHVEIRKSFHRARSFNLGVEDLHRNVIGPWVRGAPVDFGERRWQPAESTLTILEGPELDPGQIALGQGWNSATKTARDVTEGLLRAATNPSGVAVLTEREPSQRAVVKLVEALGLTAVAWPEARRRLLEAEGEAGVGAALFAVDSAPLPAPLAFEIGVAVGALGPRRTVIAALGGGPTPELDGVSAGSLDLRSSASLGELADRLRAAGLPVRPTPGWDSPTRYVDG